MIENSNYWCPYTILENNMVRLEPMSMQHVEGLYAAAGHQSIWRYMPENPSSSIDTMRSWVKAALDDVSEGRTLAYVIIVKGDIGRLVGATRLLNIRPQHKSAEIGWTWLAKDVHGTGINPAAKLLLLQLAFEHLGCIRVSFKTDVRNLQSQRALQKLGATMDGVLRDHMVFSNGHVRTSAVYSVLAREWNAVRERINTTLLPRNGIIDGQD